MTNTIVWPAAHLPLTGNELVPAVQGQRMVGIPSSVLGTGGGGGGGSGGTVVTSYANIRTAAFPGVTALILDDPYKGGILVPDPSNHADDGGLYIKDSTGQTWVRTGWERVNVAWYYDCAGHHFGDGTGIGITSADQAANAQWFGLPNYSPPGNSAPLGPYPVGTTWDYVAFQQALYACFATKSTPGNIIWNNGAGGSQTDNLPMWVPKGNITTNQGLYAEVTGCDIYCATKAGAKINYAGGVSARPALTFNALSYGSIHNLTVYCPTACPLIVSLDYTGAAGSHGLATQQLSLYDWFVSGSTIYDQVGVGIGVVGGATAQGDTIVFVNPIITSCGRAGIMAEGYNALSIMILEGDIQGCMRDGLYSDTGSFLVYGTSFQAQAAYFGQAYPQRLQPNYFGGDVHYKGDGGPTTIRVMSDVRSEGNVLFLGESYNTGVIRNCATAGADWGAWYANVTGNLGQIIGTGVDINADAILVDDGGPQWFNTAPGTTTTVIQAPGSPGWTTNQWAGRYAWLWWTNTFTQSVQVVSNTANTLTISPGIPTGMPLVGTPFKISGTGSATQPNWGSFPQGVSFVGAFGLGYGLTTTAGSNVISTVNASVLSVGWYVMVANAGQIADGNGTVPVRAPLIGKVASINTSVSPNTFTIVDAVGAPILAAYSIADATGYGGAPITDGQITWMPLDWDSVISPQQMDHVYLAKGRGRHVGNATFMGGGTPFFPQDFFRPNDTIANIIAYDNAGDQGILPLNAPMSGAVSLTGLQIAGSRSFQFEVSAASTLNLPNMFNIEARIRLYLQSTAAAPVVTWGTNIKAVAPTLTLGAANTVTVVDLAWIIAFPISGSWYVTNIQGPM